MEETTLRDELDAAADRFALIVEMVNQWASPAYANERPSQAAMVGLSEMAADMAERCTKAAGRRQA